MIFQRLLQGLLACLSLAALVSALLDGGDFVSVEKGQQVTISHSHEDIDHSGLCPASTLHSLVSELFTCTSDLDPLIGNKELNRETVSFKNDYIELKEIPQTHRVNDETEEDSDSERVVPAVIIPPLVVKATPKEVTSSSTGLPAKPTVEKEEPSEPETKPAAAEPEAGDEKARAEFERKESSVEEEPVQPDVMVPFNQWAEKKLEEAAMKGATKKDEPELEYDRGASIKTSSNGHNAKANGAFKMSKNFASPDCSAKIVGANSGSQGSGNVITSSRDEYFLNKCSQKAWFVVELCESIKAVKIQLANFELYSSSPNQFKVSVANVYPGRDKDWVDFGIFSYSDERKIETFVTEAGVVGKYVKVEVLSHHGSEHYCPVSLFKVFGIPEIDLISEDDHEEDGSDESPDVSSEDERMPHPIVQTITDAVHQVVNVFRPQNVSIVETLNTSSLQGASLRYRLRPEAGDKYDQEVINRYHMIYYLLATQYSRVRHYSRIMKVHLALPLVCPEFGIELQTRDQAEVQRYPWQFLHFLRIFHGDDFLVALCNLESMEQGHSSLVSRAKVSPPLVAASNRTANDNKTEQASEAGEEEQREPVLMERDVRTDNVSSPHQADHQADTTQEAEAELAQQTPPLELKPPEPSKTVTTSQPAGQTTWQKLSSRIKALERNVTLSTGFLEELSLKYIKQIEELNMAVKAANEAIHGINKREEISREKTDMLMAQVQTLTESMHSMETRLVELQDEVLARHGLLILGEILVLGLVIMLCRSDPARKKEQSVSPNSVPENRRRSLDTMRDHRQQKGLEMLEKRRRSFEVGCLGNGQLGSMVQQADSGLGLTKKQKKRKRRKDSKNLGLRHVYEEMESDNSNPQEPRLEEVAVSELLQPETGLSIDIISMQSTPLKGPALPAGGVEDLNGWRSSKEVKTVRFPPGKKLSSSQGGPTTQVSNIFSMLDNSVHELDSSACDTETEERKVHSRNNLNRQKFIRSKSSSPNRQENLLKLKREAIRSFQPDQAAWLQKKSE